MNLSELIDVHRGDRSYADLERACGGQPTSKRLQQLARGGIKNFPDPPTVEALARGLRVSQTAVVLAAAESLGLDVGTPMPRLVELLSSDAGDLSEEQAAAIAHLVTAIVRDPNRQSAAPRSDATEPTVREVLDAREAAGERGTSRAVPAVAKVAAEMLGDIDEIEKGSAGLDPDDQEEVDAALEVLTDAGQGDGEKRHNPPA